MIEIEWDQKFELGHDRIDFEHRIFLDLIKSVSQVVERDKAQRLLREVEKYAEFHFLSEENLMIDVEYPDYPSHREEHAYLLANLRENIFQFSHNEITLDKLVDFLFQWFALHTTQVDMKLIQFLKAKT